MTDKQDEELLLTSEEIKKIWDEDGDGWISWVQFGQAVAVAQLANVKKAGWKSPEEVYNQTMEAKKSGWDDCLKFYNIEGGLDRPELRRDISLVLAEVFKDGMLQAKKSGSYKYTDKIDQILALIPDEKEIRKQERERIIGEVVKLSVWTEKLCGRGSFIGIPESTGGIVNITPECYVIPIDKLQALKGGAK